MSVVDSSGATITKAALQGAATTTSGATTYRFNADYYEKFTYPGSEGGFEIGRRLVIHSGVPYTQEQLDKLFDVAKFSSVAPASGAVAGGTNVTISGSGFSGVSGVTIGGAAATNVVVHDAETVTCTTPAGTAGARDIVIHDDSGDVTATGAFTYQ